MKKIVILLCIACIGIISLGCENKTTSQSSNNKTIAKIDIVENSGTTMIKPLKLPNASLENKLSETRIECQLPEVPEAVEVFEPSNVREGDGTIKYSPSSNSNNPYSKEEILLPEKATEVAKKYLLEKGEDVSSRKLNTEISSRIVSYGGNIDAQVITVYVSKEINGLNLYDGNIAVKVAKGNEIVGYKKTEFDLVSKGYYKIISPKEAVDLIPKYMYVLDGTVLSTTGNITDIELCYYGLIQNNIQPVYVIKGYTDKDKKSEKFRIIIPAVK